VRLVAHPRLPPGGRLWGAGRPGYPNPRATPREVEAGVREWVGKGVDVVVSLMEDVELADRCPGLLEALRRHEIEVLRFPIADYDAPADPTAFGQLLASVCGRLARGQGVLVHCNAGLGRTATFLAALLRACGHPGDAVLEIRRIYEPDAMREPAQEAFVRGLSCGTDDAGGDPLRRSGGRAKP
jgi:protein-tyrosine phosphatase